VNVFRQLLLLSGLVLCSGCAWPVRQSTDQTVGGFVEHPFDVAPQTVPETRKPAADLPKSGSPSAAAFGCESPTAARRRPISSAAGTALAGSQPAKAAENRLAGVTVPDVPTDVRTAALVQANPEPARRNLPLRDGQVKTVAIQTDAQIESRALGPPQPKLELNIPPELPGSEAPPIQIAADRAMAEQDIMRLYPELEPLPDDPKLVPGPEGKPYTLADFQHLAAANSPTLRQAASDVEAAKGNLIQAKTYPNPTTGYLQDTSAVNNTGGVEASFLNQPIITGGKLRLGAAAAQKDLDNAILALIRARSDLSTAVRNAYFTLLVDVETLVVTRAQARLADGVYRLQVGLQKGTQAAPYEPTALRAQAFTNRLAYKQAIASYIYDWKALVATIGLPQLPISEIAGQVDRFIPYYDYDEVRAYVLQHHTDVLTARNGVKKAQYNLKLAQVTPLFPNLNLYVSLEKDFVNPPHGTYQALGLGFPLPIWDQNKGNIIAAQGTLVRAGEELHRVQVKLTNSLATAYETYRNNLYAMEYYRRNVLPDLVRYYRGVFERRQIDPTSSFGDLVFAQQNFSTNVTAYIGVLGSLWSSVVSVADLMQTDDLFQLATPRELTEVPDLSKLPTLWPCGHGASHAGPGEAVDPGKADRIPPPRSGSDFGGLAPLPIRRGEEIN